MSHLIQYVCIYVTPSFFFFIDGVMWLFNRQLVGVCPSFFLLWLNEKKMATTDISSNCFRYRLLVENLTCVTDNKYLNYI